MLPSLSLLPVLGILSQSRNSGRIAHSLHGCYSWDRSDTGSTSGWEVQQVRRMDLSKARSLIQELYFYARLHLHPTLPAPGRVPHTALCCGIPANLSINLGRSRQQQKSVFILNIIKYIKYNIKKELWKDRHLLTLQMWLWGLSGSKHPEHKGAAPAEAQQHRNWEQILTSWHDLWQGILLHPHSCHTIILMEQQSELSLHLLQFLVPWTAFEAFPIKRTLRRQVSRAGEIWRPESNIISWSFGCNTISKVGCEWFQSPILILPHEAFCPPAAPLLASWNPNIWNPSISKCSSKATPFWCFWNTSCVFLPTGTGDIQFFSATSTPSLIPENNLLPGEPHLNYSTLLSMERWFLDALQHCSQAEESHPEVFSVRFSTWRPAFAAFIQTVGSRDVFH